MEGFSKLREKLIMRQFLDGKYHRTLADIVRTNETMYSLKDFVGELWGRTQAIWWQLQYSLQEHMVFKGQQFLMILVIVLD